MTPGVQRTAVLRPLFAHLHTCTACFYSNTKGEHVDELKPTVYSDQLVLTTQQIADAYDADPQLIVNNFNRHRDRYTPSKHYYCLEGQDLKTFKTTNQFDLLTKTVNKLYLWTKRGAFMHAKSLNTDKAWDVYERLVDSYFEKSASPLQGVDVQELRALAELLLAASEQGQLVSKQLLTQINYTNRTSTEPETRQRIFDTLQKLGPGWHTSRVISQSGSTLLRTIGSPGVRAILNELADAGIVQRAGNGNRAFFTLIAQQTIPGT